MKKMKRVAVASAAALVAVTNTAFATAIYSGSSGNLAASAAFTISGSNLQIDLSNTAMVDPTASNQTLSGIFFDLGTAGLTPLSASVDAGSIIQASKCDVSVNCAAETNVGGEFSYYFGASHGISSSGYLAGNTSMGNFGGSNLDNPAALNGINFGIVTATFVDFSGNGGMDNDPLINGSVVFTLSGLTAGLSESAITNVRFQYGTSLTEPNFGGSCVVDCGGTPPNRIPEPESLALLGLGLLSLLAVRRRKA